MTHFKIMALASTVAAIVATAPHTALASTNAVQANDPVTYKCANEMSLAVSYVDVRGHGAALVTFPDGRETGAKATRLLAETQTGSGVRYASDIATLHVKNENARFETAESAASEAIASTACKTSPDPSAAPKPDGPITQEALAGRYFIRSFDGPGYFPAEAICFASDGAKYFGLSRASEQGDAVTYTESRIRYADVSPVDAGAGQRRYTLTAVDNTASQVQLHFTAPGMREADLPSATAGFSSISEGRFRMECVDSDRLVYVGTNSQHGIAITLEDDGLAVRAFGEGQDPKWPEIRQGYLALGDDHAAFHFVDQDGNHISAKVHNSGGLIQGAWRLDSSIAQRETIPGAYFLANRAAYLKGSARITLATSKLLDRLADCNHLSGEASDDAERNRVLTVEWEKASCDTVPAAHAEALARYADQGPLTAYLKRQSPVWK